MQFWNPVSCFFSSTIFLLYICENKNNEQHHPHSRHIQCENSVIISIRIINDVQTSKNSKLKFKHCLNDTSNHSLNFKSSFSHFVPDSTQRGTEQFLRNPTWSYSHWDSLKHPVLTTINRVTTWLVR